MHLTRKGTKQTTASEDTSEDRMISLINRVRCGLQAKCDVGVSPNCKRFNGSLLRGLLLQLRNPCICPETPAMYLLMH